MHRAWRTVSTPWPGVRSVLVRESARLVLLIEDDGDLVQGGKVGQKESGDELSVDQAKGSAFGRPQPRAVVAVVRVGDNPVCQSVGEEQFRPSTFL